VNFFEIDEVERLLRECVSRDASIFDDDLSDALSLNIERIRHGKSALGTVRTQFDSGMFLRWLATSHREISKWRRHLPLRQTYAAFCTSAVLRLATAPSTSVDLADFPCDNIRYVSRGIYIGC
jgi:hypothetical protein